MLMSLAPLLMLLVLYLQDNDVEEGEKKIWTPEREVRKSDSSTSSSEESIPHIPRCVPLFQIVYSLHTYFRPLQMTVVMNFLSVAMNFLPVAMNFLPVVMNFLSVAMNFLSVVMNFLSVVMNFLSVVMNFLSVVMNFLSVIMNFNSLCSCTVDAEETSLSFFTFRCLLNAVLKTAILALVIGSAVRQTGPLLCIEGSFVQGYVNPGLRANLRLTYNSRPDKYLTELTAAWKYPTIFF